MYLIILLDIDIFQEILKDSDAFFAYLLQSGISEEIIRILKGNLSL